MASEIKPKKAEILQYGNIRYDPHSGELTDMKAGNALRLRKQSADVLAVLAANIGDLVSKETLIRGVWADVVTTDDSLIQCISDIRRVLGRNAIETHPKKGYSLKKVKHSPISVVDGSTENVSASENPSIKAGANRRGALAQHFLIGTTILLAALLLVKFNTVTHESPIVPPAIRPERTLAVLPFADLGDDQSMAHFSNGLGEDLTTDLSKVEGLTVIAYTSSLGYENAESEFKNIALELGVRYLIRGTIRNDGDRVRINVSLIDPNDGASLWSERYDRIKSNPFDVQANVARHVVSALKLKLDVKTIDNARVEPDAHHMLLRGLLSLRELSTQGNLIARQFFEKAVALDPEYARAHASIAITYARGLSTDTPGSETQETIEKGLQSAIHAIQLDPDLPHAYYAVGLLNLSINKHDNAIAATRHALTLDSNFSDGYELLAEATLHGGDLNEALSAIRRAKVLHPKHPPSYDWTEGHILFQLEQFGAAETVFQNANDETPSFYHGLLLSSANAARLGDFVAASKRWDRAMAIRPEFTVEAAALKVPYRSEVRRERLLSALRLVDR